MLPVMSRFWRRAFNLLYRILAFVDPLVRAFWRRFGLGNVVELEIERRNGRGPRRRLLGLLRAGDRWYLGHPNGPAGWTRDLDAAEEGTLRWPDGTAAVVRPHLLEPGEEREAAIRATGQHPFPGNLVYRLARGHVRAVGVFYRLRLTDDAP
jgi:hypothetical protein